LEQIIKTKERKMNKTLTIFLIAISSVVYSQRRETPQAPVKFANFAYVTESRDTLFLAENDPSAINTVKVWKADPEWDGTNPVIVMIPQADLDRKKKALLPKY
jgi:hypothetical protein